MLASDIYRETKLSKLQLYMPPFTTQLSKYSLGGWGSASCHTETIQACRKLSRSGEARSDSVPQKARSHRSSGATLYTLQV